MSKRFFEGAQHAATYALTRPTYPKELIEKIVVFLREKYKGPMDFAADVGCGSGQSTELLGNYFEKVYGLDISENQIKEARVKYPTTNIDFRTNKNNEIPLQSNSLCLITAAQAAHWFDLKKFYSEVDRTLKPKGVLAIYGYGLPEIVGEHGAELTEIFRKFYKKMRPFFPPDRSYIDNKYSEIVLPYADRIRDETVKIKYQWELDRFLAYVTSWSGYVRYMEKYPDDDVIEQLRNDLLKTNRIPDEKTPLEIHFETFLLLGRK